MYNTKGSYAAELFYYINQATLKLSILALYWRVFSSANYINISIKYIGGYVIIWFIASVSLPWYRKCTRAHDTNALLQFIVAALQCVPVQAIWDPVAKMEPGVRCVNLNAFFFGTSVPNIVADLVLVLLPTPQVLQLKITTTQKVFVIFFFLLGGL